MSTEDLVIATCSALDRAMEGKYISPGIVWGKTVSLSLSSFIVGGKNLDFELYRDAVTKHCEQLLYKYRIRWWECFSDNQRKRDIEDSLSYAIETLRKTQIRIPLSQLTKHQWILMTEIKL